MRSERPPFALQGERKLSLSYPYEPKNRTNSQAVPILYDNAKRASHEANPLQSNSYVLVLKQLPRRDSNPRPGD